MVLLETGLRRCLYCLDRRVKNRLVPENMADAVNNSSQNSPVPSTHDCPEGAKLQGICLALSGQWALRVVENPERRCALPWAKLFEPVGLKTTDMPQLGNSMASSARRPAMPA